MQSIQSNWAAFRDSYYFWDWITLGCGVVSVVGFLVALTMLLGLPGRIAIARKHPDAEAVYAMGWVGFLAVVPWIQAFIWAFKPTDKVDLRRLPKEEQAAEKEDLARLEAYVYGRKRKPETEANPEPEAKPVPESATVAMSEAVSEPEPEPERGSDPGPDGDLQTGPSDPQVKPDREA